MIKAQLRYLSGPGRTESFDLGESPAEIGSAPGLAVSLPVPGIEARHARVVWDGSSHWIEDLAGKGTFVNGRPVKRHKLRHLFVVNLGGAADLLFLLTGQAEDAAQPRLLRAVLSPLGADLEPYEVPLGHATLGRSPDCALVIPDERISRRHARLERTATQLVVQDLGSMSATWVNGTSVHRRPLRDLDLLSLAGVVSFRVDLEFGEPPPPREQQG